MIPRAHTLILLGEELPGASAWAERNKTTLSWNEEHLELRVIMLQPGTGELFYLRGNCDNYREVPPAWTFTDAEWKALAKHLFPQPAPLATGLASIFHTQPVICAPFNRLAYKEHGGPHDNWGGPESWLTAGQPNEVKAFFLGDMLSVMHQHLLPTRGRMA